MQRREFLRRAFAGAVALAAGSSVPAAIAGPGRVTKVNPARLPRWRGFNLLEKFTLSGSGPYRAEDFDWIHGWGFDFVRLPMDNRCWTAPDDPYRLEEKSLKEIDQAVQDGRARDSRLPQLPSGTRLLREPAERAARPLDRH